MFPTLRQPKKWFHKFQHLYMFLAFPLMQVAFQVGDITGLVTKDCEGAKLHGATALELSTVVIGKLAHFGLLLAPALKHGWAAVGAGVAASAARAAPSLVCKARSHQVDHVESRALGDDSIGQRAGVGRRHLELGEGGRGRALPARRRL